MVTKATKDSRMPRKSQRQTFIDAARKAECDESEDAFVGNLAWVGKHKTANKPKKKVGKQ